MSVTDNPERPHEIIIVRRRNDDGEDGHHGGAWKIAFADFMTAMMCFFLVMWLVNAANEQTKAAVASYFNPVKLIDRNSSRKGLEEVGDGPNAVGSEAESPTQPKAESGADGPSTSGPSSDKNSAESAETKSFSDENLFADPYAVLAEIAADTGKRQNISEKGDGGAQEAGPATGASGGESYRDPFAPDFWSKQVARPETDQNVVEETQAAFAVLEPEKPAETPTPDVTPPVPPEPQAPAAETVEAKLPDLAPPKLPEPLAERAPDRPANLAPSEAAERAAEEVREALGKALGGTRLEEGITVTAENSRVVISITDQFDDGMFEIGSAVPRAGLVKAMEKVGNVIAARGGGVSINGHTDGRPFRSADYDNWRLSTARAHSAYYMLVRGGLQETRISEVAGHADRRLEIPANPLDAANRRIEILLDAVP